MHKVYCDTGGYRSELRVLQENGVVELCTYEYENKNRRVAKRAPPSNPTWKQGALPWQRGAEGTWDDYQGSQLWPQVLELIGRNNLTDAKHLDSAYKAGCSALITSDKDDIASQADAILALTGIRVFHAYQDWPVFLAFIQQSPADGGL
jgi:hypothetical protein